MDGLGLPTDGGFCYQMLQAVNLGKRRGTAGNCVVNMGHRSDDEVSHALDPQVSALYPAYGAHGPAVRMPEGPQTAAQDRARAAAAILSLGRPQHASRLRTEG